MAYTGTTFIDQMVDQTEASVSDLFKGLLATRTQAMIDADQDTNQALSFVLMANPGFNQAVEGDLATMLTNVGEAKETLDVSTITEIVDDLTWGVTEDDRGILGNAEGTLSEGDDTVWGYFGDADQVRTDNDSEASVTFVLSIDETQPEPDEENAVNIQITNFTAGDVLDVSSFAGDLAVGDTPVVTGVDINDGVLGISMVAADPVDVVEPTDIAPAWNIEFPEIDQTLVDGLSAMGDGDLTAGLNAELGTEDFWLVL